MNNAKRSLRTAERKAWPTTGHPVKVQEGKENKLAGGGDHFERYRDRNALCRGRARDVLTENVRRSFGRDGNNVKEVVEGAYREVPCSA
jgi:hypothetical protein